MKILIIGSCGSMGTRYVSILKHLGIDFFEYDLELPVSYANYLAMLKQCDKAIIAVPTKYHITTIKECIRYRKDFLCEKPISKKLNEIKTIFYMAREKKVKGNMVDNWRRVQDDVLEAGSNKIYYNNFRTGGDGLEWDCIQLYYLSKGEPEISTDKPFFEAVINGKEVNYMDIEKSYIKMIKSWLGENDLWTLEDGYNASEMISKRLKNA